MAFDNSAPAWLVGLAMLALAAGAALALYGLLARILRSRLDPGRMVLRAFLKQVAGPARLALVIIALALTLPAAPFDAPARAAIEHGLLLGFIVLFGWAALSAAALGADLYMGASGPEDSLRARKHATQIRILKRAADFVIVIVTFAAALTTFEPVRQFGVSLFASAGVAGLILGLAARPVLSNLIAGIQIAVTQPIRLEDAVVVEGETGLIEEIGSTYVVVRLWDFRRLIVPLTHFIEKPFENWTREPSPLIGSVILHADPAIPVERVRARLEELVKASPFWDGRMCKLEVTDATRDAVQLRALASARTPQQVWDLRCEIREKMLAVLREEAAAARRENGPAGAGQKPKVRQPAR